MSTEPKVFNLEVQEIEVTVTRKAVKNVQLSVYPPDGNVKMTVPMYLGDEAVRNSIITRLNWIRKQRDKFLSQARQSRREMVTGETVYWLGQRYRLSVKLVSGQPCVVQNRVGFIDLWAPPNSNAEQREHILYEWYREHFKLMIPDLLRKWEPVVGVHAESWGVKRMKTRWGTCIPEAKRIWLNLELAKKPVNCIEYVLVHELVHLLERSHNARFKALMGRFMPTWSQFRAELNEAPLADETWEC